MRGVIKEVPSGDTVVVAAGAKAGALPSAEKRLTLSSVLAPKLVRPDHPSPAVLFLDRVLLQF
jgi:staphylococcal nuclease domain-containing protein 1